MAMSDLVRSLRTFTAARIGLQATGASLATREVLQLAQDHALARDAVQAPFNTEQLRSQLQELGHPVLQVHSRAPDRATYLRRPDFGRQLGAEDAATLSASQLPGSPQPAVVVVIADGLSAAAPGAHALPLIRELAALSPARWANVPVVLAKQARVALGDAVGVALQAQLVLVLIGERPGMSAHDSLGAYLTYAPQPGRTDAERNCVSNIRPQGLGYAQAAHQLHWLVDQALTRGVTGIELKDESGPAPLHIGAPPANIGA
jgi:ethanolamine ammonia-lyase small subunit